MDGDGQLPRSGNGLHDDVGLLNAKTQQLVLGALDQRIDYGGVPARVHDADAQAAAVVLLRRRSLERVCHLALLRSDWWICFCFFFGLVLGEVAA